MEKYKDIPYNTNYKVSNEGRVYSKKYGKHLKLQTLPTGYHSVSISGNGSETKTVHKLVASLFVEPYFGQTVNHKDGNKKNNHFTNLEWTTYSENVQHAYDIGIMKTIPVNRYSLDGKLEKEYKSATEAIKDGYYKSLITYCCKGARKTHKNKIWKYADK